MLSSSAITDASSSLPTICPRSAASAFSTSRQTATIWVNVSLRPSATSKRAKIASRLPPIASRTPAAETSRLPASVFASVSSAVSTWRETSPTTLSPASRTAFKICSFRRLAVLSAASRCWRIPSITVEVAANPASICWPSVFMRLAKPSVISTILPENASTESASLPTFTVLSRCSVRA